MYQIFSRDNGLAFLLLTVLLGVMRLRQLLDPMHYALTKSVELSTPAWDACFGWASGGGLGAVAAGLVLTLLTAHVVNVVVDTYALTDNRSAMAAFCYVVLSGGFYLSLCLPATLIFAPCLTMSVDRMYTATRKDKPSLDVFWSAAWMTVGCIFWSKGVWFLPFMFLMMMELSVANSRTMLSGVLGVLATLTGFLTIGVCATDSFDFVSETWSAIWPAEPSRHWSYKSVIYGGVLIGVLVMALFALQGKIAQMKISQSRRMRVARWLAVGSVLLMAVPNYSMEVQPVAAVGASLTIPAFLEYSRSTKTQELVCLLLVAVTVWFIWQ